MESSSETSLGLNSREIVWGLRTDSLQQSSESVLKGNAYVPFVTYTEVLLSAAECAYHLGNRAEAMAYSNRVTQARNLPLISEVNFIESLRSVWQSELKGFGNAISHSYRRNNLAVEQLNIKDYQQLLPIPLQEIEANQNLIQNPGWK